MRQLDGRGVCYLAMGQGLLRPMLVGLPPSAMDGGLDIHLDARYLPGQSHVLADSLGHRKHVEGTEWSLHPGVGSSPLCV